MSLVAYGILVPLLDPAAAGATIHNIRAAFVSGLAHGMRKQTLILQDSDGPVPLDLRDFAKFYRHPADIDDHVQSFALDVYEEMQTAQQVDLPPRGYLANLFVGDPMAENEFQTLGRYYLPTDEFRRALRGDVSLVVGRKGTGKTAFFSQVRDQLRQDRSNVVVDLKPEGYQLVKLKEDVLDYLSEGAKAHLITAFGNICCLWKCAIRCWNRTVNGTYGTRLFTNIIVSYPRSMNEMKTPEKGIFPKDCWC